MQLRGVPRPGDAAIQTLKSGELELVHYGERWGGFTLNAGGEEMASGHDSGRIAFFADEAVHWLELNEAPVQIDAGIPGRLAATAVVRDASGGEWTLRRTFSVGCARGIDRYRNHIGNKYRSGSYPFSMADIIPRTRTVWRAQTASGFFPASNIWRTNRAASKADIRGEAPRAARAQSG